MATRSKPVMYLLEIALKEPEFFTSRKPLGLVVGIPSAGRRGILAAALPYIARQSRLPDEVVVCLSCASDFDEDCLKAAPFPVRILISTPGSCRQRNHILENVPNADVVVFLDDDFLMESSYLERTEQLFVRHPDIAVCTGKVLADGILGPGISVEEGIRMLNGRPGLNPETAAAFSPIYNAYGCNMAVRMSAVRAGELRFDENLPLYGWLEDVDFSRMAARHGKVVSADGLNGVHLGIKVARTPGIRLGYSQVANPVYLMRKQTMSVRHASVQIGRNILANVLRLWRPEPWVDRKGRLNGNFRAFADLFMGRLTPKNVEKTLMAMARREPDRVIIINDRSTMVGGASNLAILSAQLLERAGIGVTFFAGDNASDIKPVADTINLAGAPLIQQGRLAAFAGGLYNAKAYGALRQLVDRADTPSTLYHVHGWSKILSPSIFRALSSVRDRVVLHAHDYFLACPNGGFANYRTHNVCTLNPMSVRCLTTQCDKRGYHEKVWRSVRHMMRERFFPIGHEPANIVVVHEGMRDYFIRAGIDVAHVTTIRNPIEPFLSVPNQPWDRRELFFIGRLEPEKGFADAAAAARLAHVPLHVVGDGAGRGLLERDYPEITIHGWQSRDGLRDILRRARAIVVSSRVPEPFALAAVEAVASGIPVIVPEAALLGKQIAALDCGLTFRNGNIQSLADAMGRMNADDALIRRMSANCLREAPHLANTAQSWGEALIALYSDILSRSVQLEAAE